MGVQASGETYRGKQENHTAKLSTSMLKNEMRGKLEGFQLSLNSQSKA